MYTTDMNISTKLESLTLSETRKCPRCGVIKNILEDFHKGASACKECRKLDYSDKKGPSVKKSDLVELVKELALKVEKMERAFKRRSFELSDDEDFEDMPKKSENPQKASKKKPKQSELEKTAKSKSDVETGDDGSDEELAKKAKSRKSKPDVEATSDSVRKNRKVPDNIKGILDRKKVDKRRH
jgi:hypothetical protein